MVFLGFFFFFHNLHHKPFVWSQPEICVWFGARNLKSMWVYHKKIQKRAGKMTGHLGNLVYENTWANLGLFSLWFYLFSFIQSLWVLLSMDRAQQHLDAMGTAAESTLYRMYSRHKVYRLKSICHTNTQMCVQQLGQRMKLWKLGEARKILKSQLLWDFPCGWTDITITMLLPCAWTLLSVV